MSSACCPVHFPAGSSPSGERLCVRKACGDPPLFTFLTPARYRLVCSKILETQREKLLLATRLWREQLSERPHSSARLRFPSVKWAQQFPPHRDSPPVLTELTIKFFACFL